MISRTQKYTVFYFYFLQRKSNIRKLKCSMNQCHEKEHIDKCVQDKFTVYTAQRFIGKLLSQPFNKVLYFHSSKSASQKHCPCTEGGNSLLRFDALNYHNTHT